MESGLGERVRVYGDGDDGREGGDEREWGKRQRRGKSALSTSGCVGGDEVGLRFVKMS